MTTAWHHRWRRLRFALTGLLAAAVIGVAVAVALAQLLLPLAAHYPQRIATMLQRQIGQPVHFAGMSGHWQPSGPLLTLREVTIGGRDGSSALHLPTAEVKLDLGALLWPSRHLVNLRLRGLQLDLARGADGRWQVAGFGRSGGAVPQDWSINDLPGNVWLEDLQLRVSPGPGLKPIELTAPAVRVSNGDGHLRFAAALGRPGLRSRLNLVGEADADGAAGRMFLQASDVDLGALLHGLGAGGVSLQKARGSAGLWLGWHGGRVDRLVLRSDLSDLQLDTPGGAVRVPAWRATLAFTRDGDTRQWWYDQGARGALRVVMVGQGQARRVDAAVRAMDLSTPAALLAAAPGLPERWSHWLAAAHVHGRIDQGQLHWSSAGGLHWLAATLDGVGTDAVGATPGVDALSGQLFGDAGALSLHLPQQATTLRMTGLFRKPLVLGRIGGDLAAWRTAEGWHLGTGALDFEGEGYGGQLRGQILLPAGGGRPFLDVYAALGHGQVTAAKLFWPLHHMPAHTIEWLDRSLVSGQIAWGRCVLRGNLGDWPFVNHHGRFEASAQLHDAVLDYNPKWPRAEHIDAEARFIDDSMVIEGTGASALGNHATHVVAIIPAYRLGKLLLVAQGVGKGGQMLDFVRRSPVGSDYADAIGKLSLGGTGQFDFSMILPFQHPEDVTLAGGVNIKGADVADPDWGVTLKGMRGRLRFDSQGLWAPDLSAGFRGVPVNLSLQLGRATGDPAVPVRVRAEGTFKVATLIRDYDVLAPLKQATRGSAPFDIGVDVEKGADGEAKTWLQVDSPLRGVSIDLPAPLSKPDAASTLPLHLRLGLPPQGRDIRISLGDVARARGRLEGAAGQPLALAVRLGDQWPDSVPTRGLRIGGRARLLDLSGWAQRGLAAAGDDAVQLDGVDVKVDHAEVFDKLFDDLHLQLKPGAHATTLTVDGPQAKGTLTVPTGEIGQRGVVMRFDRLFWPGDEPAKNGQAKGGTDSDSAQAPMVAMSEVAPAKLPPLHVWVGKLRLGKARLGEARFESWPTAKGMHIDQLRTHSPDVQLTASGDWNGTAKDNHTHLVIDFGAESLGHMLSALGFGGLFEGGRTQAHLDATWPGAPSAVELARMQGTLRVDVGKGRIPEVQPGVGRLFGLMSIAELPRRFALDFGDVFGKGFGFDSIKGRFRFADGSAYTSDLHIKGPAADIYVTGRTGLRAKDYDQQVRVIPHVGSSLPVVGAIAGGPVGAAAGFAVQGLLGRGLNRVASARYAVTGPWDKPRVKLLEKKTVKASRAEKRSAQPASTSSVPAAPATVPAAPASAPGSGG